MKCKLFVDEKWPVYFFDDLDPFDDEDELFEIPENTYKYYTNLFNEYHMMQEYLHNLYISKKEKKKNE